MIIDTQLQLEYFFSECNKSDIFIVPILQDEINHPVNNGISSIYVYCINTKEEFLLLVNHHDKIFLDLSLDTINSFFTNFPNKIFCIFKKKLLYFLNGKNLIDLEIKLYLETLTHLKFTSLSELLNNFYEHLFGRINKQNILIPVSKHLEYGQTIKNEVLPQLELDVYPQGFKYYNDLIPMLLQQVELVGLYYDKEKFKEFYPNKNKELKFDFLYTQYNIFTSTGRPSNKFNGINFAALNKKTGLRNIFISRFGNDGKLVEFDFDAYHLQLIANEISYKFPTDINLHVYLGRQYFGKDDLTEEEYNQSKEISFRLLYGGIDKDFEKIEFFGLVSQYINKFWHELNNNGSYSSPIFKRKLIKSNIPNVNKYTAWNYFIQLLETENSLVTIYQILNSLNNKKSKLILYTYDGFLFDIINEEWDELKVKLQRIFNNKGFHAKIKEGKNYGELISIR